MLQCKYQWNVRRKKARWSIQKFDFIQVHLITYMCTYRADQHLIVLNLYSVSINTILVLNGIYYCGGFTESQFDVKYVSTVKSTT